MHIITLMDTADVKVTPHIVVYIDFLGTGDKIQKENGEPALNEIYEIYHSALRYKQRKKTELDFQKLKVKVFSDNILIAIPSPAINDLTSLQTILSFAASIQLKAFIEYNWLIRGGVSYGYLYLDEVFVWGDALLDAYRIESTVAKYPRIVISGDIISELDDENINRLNICYDDSDGCYFLSYMEHSNMIKFEGELDSLNERCQNLIKKYSSEPEILPKYIWLRDYHHHLCLK